MGEPLAGYEPEPIVVIPGRSSVGENTTAPIPAAAQSADVNAPPTFFQALFSLEARAKVLKESASASPCTFWFFYLIYFGAGVFVVLNSIALGTVLAKHRNACQTDYYYYYNYNYYGDTTYGDLLIAVSVSSLVSIFTLFALNRQKERPSVWLTLLLIASVVTALTTGAIAEGSYYCYDTGVWDAYLGGNWVLISVLLLEAFVVRIPWRWLISNYVAPFFKFFVLVWPNLDNRAALLRTVFGFQSASALPPAAESALSISAVHSLIKFVFFIFAALYTLAVIAIVYSAETLGSTSNVDCVTYGAMFLTCVLLTMLYLPLPLVVAFAGRFRAVVQGIMLFMVAALVACTAVGEAFGDSNDYYGYGYYDYNGYYYYYYNSVSECNTLTEFRWYLHFSWFLVAPLFLDAIATIVVSCCGKRAAANSVVVGEPLLTPNV